MNPPAILLYFDDEMDAALRLGQASGLIAVRIERHRFPDDEIRLRLPDALPERVVVLRTLDHPNEKLVELLMVARTARMLGARHLTLVAPYLSYMRQDIAFIPGEVVSQRIVGQFLAGLFDAVITVDPHLHRVDTLAEAVPARQAIVLSGAPLLADLIAQRRPGALLLGPDSESAQWVAQAALRHGFDYGVCSKLRRSDHAVEIELPPLRLAGRAVVLIDDLASTGNTVAHAARLLLAVGAAAVDVAVTHALLNDQALQMIRVAGVDQVWSTDSIAHPTNAVSLAPLLGQTLQSLNQSGT